MPFVSPFSKKSLLECSMQIFIVFSIGKFSETKNRGNRFRGEGRRSWSYEGDPAAMLPDGASPTRPRKERAGDDTACCVVQGEGEAEAQVRVRTATVIGGA